MLNGFNLSFKIVTKIIVFFTKCLCFAIFLKENSPKYDQKHKTGTSLCVVQHKYLIFNRNMIIAYIVLLELGKKYEDKTLIYTI